MAKKKYKYCIQGPAKFNGASKKICRYISAYSGAQAFKRLAIKLEKETNKKVYLGDCALFPVKELPPRERKKEKQMEFKI